MNRFRSSSVLLPAGLVLLLAASCKGPSNEAAEPTPYTYDDPYAEEPDLALEPDPEGPAVEVPADEMEAQDPASEVAPDPEAEAEAAPEPSPSPAPPPPTARTESSSTSDQEDGVATSVLLDEALSKDADNDLWGIHPYLEAQEAKKPNVRDNYVFLLAGVRDLQESAWEPVENPGTGGINYMGRGPGGWFHWDVAFSYGSENGNVSNSMGTFSVESTIWELDFGIVKMFGAGKVVRPYLGLGLTYMRAGGQVFTSTGPVDDSGTTFGGYGRAGLAFDITRWGGLIGVDLRYVGGTSVSFGSLDTNADGFVGSITFGYSW